MANPDGELTVAQRLGRALDRGLLPAGGPAEAAERLIERLERPARVALLGLPGSGKSSILNLLVGAIVVPETLRLPTIIVQHGDVTRMHCTLTDGTTRIIPGNDLAEVLPLAPALVTLEMDLPALGVISLLEVSAGPMEAEQKRAATWASKRADIVIWCTTSYLPKEQAVWESLPDAVKDNSFMFLTKTDLLGSRESASAMHDRVELRAGEEFRQILSISAKQARAAMPTGGQVNRDLFRDSGASAVITAIKTRVQSGRRADMDTAELLLARHAEASELVARRFAEPGAEAEPTQSWTPPPEPEEQDEKAERDGVPAADAAAAARDPSDITTEEAVAASGEEEKPPETEAATGGALTELEPRDDPEPDREPEVEDEPQPMPDDAAPAAVIIQSEPASATRKRFADRIKRMSGEGESASAPMVPLKSTWKSKAEAEPIPDPEPQPPPRQVEATRRPRAAPQSVPDETDGEARTASGASSAPDHSAEPAPDVEPDAPQRRPRAVTPRPEPVAEAPRSVRPQLFGGRRAAGPSDSPLPDLSGLRATPEEIAAAAEARELDGQTSAEDNTSAQLDADDDWEMPGPETEQEATPEPEVPAVVPRGAGDRPRLFDRVRKAEPAVPQPAEPAPSERPVSRLPAPPRAPLAYDKPEPTAPRAAADDAQFSPRAIMMRERRVEPDAPAPRRERTRIAARAVPATPAPVAAVPGTDQSLIDEAIGLIVTRSEELARQIDPEAKVPVDLILDHTRETGEQIQSVVSRGQSDALRRINSDLGEVMDLIMLMQLEKGHAPADDALTLLLQLRRELETLRAA